MPSTSPKNRKAQPSRSANRRAFFNSKGKRIMRISTALAPLIAAASAAASDAAAHSLVLIIAMVLATQAAFVALFVCLPAARRRDLLKLVRAARRRR